MDNERLFHFLTKLERLSSVDAISDPRDADEILKQINCTVLTMKDELSGLNPSWKSMSSQSSFAETRLTIESVEAARSGIASTVGIDDTIPKPSETGGLGFIDAIRLAALSVESGAAPGQSQPNTSGAVQSAGQQHSSEKPKSGTFSTDSKEDHHFFLPSSKPGSSSTLNSSEAQLSAGHIIPDIDLLAPTPLPVNQLNGNNNLKPSRRVKNFGKCFPAYRKLFRYETQSRSFLRSKSGNTFSSALSLDTTHMALVNEHKYQVFEIPEEYNERPKLKFAGETGFHRTHCFVAMNNMWLVAASSDGVVLVVSLQDGRILFSKNLRLQITALSVSSEGSYIGVAIVKNPETKNGGYLRQPLIYLICPSIALSPESAFEHPDIVSFSSPYQDFIKTISFNDGETAMICSTEKESRIFIVSLADYREPRILLRSRRSNTADGENILLGDADRQSEGITGASFLPNSRYVLLSSSAPNAPPVVLDTKLSVTKGKSPTGKIVQYLQPSGQQQTVIIRFDKMGSAIQSCTASIRGNGAAFADCSGSVYAVNLPTVSTEPRKIAVVFDLAPGTSSYTAPALRFCSDGTALIAVDRKGDIHIADFGAGHPQQPDIMKTKVLS